jgi:histidinol-phosphate aminotransferase
MNPPLELMREDLQDFSGYASARRDTTTGRIWLNANESAWRNPCDGVHGANRYPEPQPAELLAALAAMYGVGPRQVLASRGSDEAIDLLVRLFCRPGLDPVVLAPPVFGMYAVCARLHGAPVVEVPLAECGDRFRTDLPAMVDAALERGARLVFICSPANPTGQSTPLEEVAWAADRLAGRAMLVVDEAYADYAATPSATRLLERCANLAVLRTLSKAHGLAGARVGCLLAEPSLIAQLRKCQAPYPLAIPSVRMALAALSPGAQSVTRARVALVVGERERMRTRLAALPGVRCVYRSEGNFLLARFMDADAAMRGLRDAGVVVRDMRASPALSDALRISIGAPTENLAVLEALGCPEDAR